MKELNENLKARVELEDWKYDDEDNIYPVSYCATLLFYGKCYTMYFTVNDIKNFESYYLDNSGCEGPSELFGSMNSYFEYNETEAQMLIDMMREEWDSFDDNKVYDFIANKING